MQPDSVDLTISIPAALADADAAERARVLLVLDAVRTEKLTWRAAAAALGIAPDELLDLARAHGVPVTRYDEAAMRDDLATLEALERGNSPGA
jgi:hypothetical protein